MVKMKSTYRKINAILLSILRQIDQNWLACVDINWQQIDKISRKYT